MNLDFEIVEWESPTDLDWQSPEEQVTYAHLRITVGGVCITEVYDAETKENRSTILVCLMPLVSWLLENWEALLIEENWPGTNRNDSLCPPNTEAAIEWRINHCMAAVGQGFLWPDVTIYAEGDGVRIIHVPGKAEYGHITYLNEVSVVVPQDEVRRAIVRLVRQVADRVESLGHGTGVRDAAVEAGLFRVITDAKLTSVSISPDGQLDAQWSVAAPTAHADLLDGGAHEGDQRDPAIGE